MQPDNTNVSITDTPTPRPDFGALYSKELLDTQILPNFNKLNPYKKLTLITLTKTDDELIDIAKNNIATFSDVLDAVSQANEQLEAEYELAEAALARVMWVGAYVSEQKGASHE